MKTTLLNVMRVALGLLFIFSGFVKCIDPTGGAIKIEDYFVAWGFDAPGGLELILSFVQNILEFMAGFMLLLNLFVPFSSLLVLLFMAVFTPLTLYIAIANPVSDCGCFGDAVKLTNWQTFFKNLVFLPMAVVVFWQRKMFTSSLRPWRRGAAICVGLIVSFLVSLSGLTNEPFVDFRPYSVGTDIEEAMSIPEGAPMPEYRSTFILEKDGKQQEFDEHNYPYDDSTWVYVDTRTEVVSEGYVPPIKDFSLFDAEGEVVTSDILRSADPVIMAISPRVEDISVDNAKKLGAIAAACVDSQARFYVVTASSGAALTLLSDKADFPFNYLSADETMLKTITRCNPGIIAVQSGVIVAKYHIDHAPQAEALRNPLKTYLTNIEIEHARMTVICTILAVGIFLVLLYKKHKRNLK